MDIINDVNMNAGVMEVQPLCNTDIHLKGNLVIIIKIYRTRQVL